MMYNPVDLDRMTWAAQNPDLCPCRGGGWLLSGYDTFHRCAIHGKGVPHPEDDEGDEHFDSAAHLRACYVEAYRTFRDIALTHKNEVDTPCFTDEASFTACVKARVKGGGPSEFVAVAEEIADHLSRLAADRSARSRGYACALEERWAWEALEERRAAYGF